MFKRLVLEDWHLTMPAIGFCVFFTLFVIVVIWTFRMKKEKAERLAQLPLENDNQSSSNRNH